MMEKYDPDKFKKRRRRQIIEAALMLGVAFFSFFSILWAIATAII